MSAPASLNAGNSPGECGAKTRTAIPESRSTAPTVAKTTAAIVPRSSFSGPSAKPSGLSGPSAKSSGPAGPPLFSQISSSSVSLFCSSSLSIMSSMRSSRRSICLHFFRHSSTSSREGIRPGKRAAARAAFSLRCSSVLRSRSLIWRSPAAADSFSAFRRAFSSFCRILSI